MAEPAQQLLGDRYRLLEPIACGGMGQVWRGLDTLLGRPVAVKVLRSEYTGDPTFLARFRTEAVHAAALAHPHIAAVFDYGETPAADGGEQLAYLVMELVEGRPLSSMLQDGPLGTEETLSILRQTAEALAEAHHVGLVHRDVKPGNILVSADEQVKITDFGIAWSAGSVPLTQAGQVLGTPQYLSPELAVGGDPSPASDVYSLGLVGYECLTGQPAFTGDNPVAVALKQVHEEPAPLPAELPPAVRALVDVAVAKDPTDRPADGEAFVAAIDRVLDAGHPAEGPTSTQPVPLVGRPPAPVAPRRPAPRRRRAVLVAALLTLVAAGLVAVVALTHRPGGGTAEDTPSAAAIVLDGSEYVGRPVDEVAAELDALGLTVRREAAVTPGVAAGAVTRLSPSGAELQPGDTVTVVFADGASTDLAVEPGGTTVVATDPSPGPVGPGVVPAPAGAPGGGAGGGTGVGGTAGAGSAVTGAGAAGSGVEGTAPTGTAPTAAAPTDALPTDSAPTDSVPTDSAPTDSEPTESAPTDAGPTESSPTDSEPSDPAPTDTSAPTDTGTPTGSPDAGSTPAPSDGTGTTG